MKKIIKKAAAAGTVLAIGIIVSRGRDFWGCRASHHAGEYDGENAGVFGDDPAYQMVHNPHGDVIFADAGKALRRFRDEHRGIWEPLQKTYSLPALRTDTCALYWAYQQQDASPNPTLSVFLQTFLNGTPK